MALSKTFCLRGPKKLRNWSLLCFRNLLIRKKKYGKEIGGRVSQFSIETFLCHSANKVRGRSFQVIGKFPVLKNFEHQKEIALLCVETFFYLTVPKNFVEETFNVSIIFWCRKF